MKAITLKEIKELAGNDETINRSLTFGFLRSCTEEQLFHLLKKHLYEKQIFSQVFRCYLEQPDKQFADQLATRFLSELQRQPDYHRRQALGFCLDRLLDKCGPATRTKTIRTFLDSGKRYLRKYAYKKDLSSMPVEILEIAYRRLEEFPEEAPYFLHAAAYTYPDAFIEENFHRLIAFEYVDQYQLNKLFLRKANLSSDDWNWLEEHRPDNVLYIAAKRGRVLTDDECVRFAGSLNKIIEHSWGKFEEPDGLKLWCLAKMGKWEILRTMLKTTHQCE